MYLVCIGQSTNENIRAVWDSVPNPYDQGCCYNYVGMCMQGVPQSRLQDMHEVMSEEDFLLNLGPAWARGGGGSAVSLGGGSSLGSLGGSQSALASAGASASSQRVGSPTTTPLSGAAAASASAAAEAVGDTDERGRSPARVPEASNRPLSPLARLAAAMSAEKSVKKGTTTTTTPLLSATSKHGSKDKGLSQYDR